MIDLEKGQLMLVRKILRQQVPNCEVWVFGSRINGKAYRFSDLDLVLIGNRKITWELMESLRDKFAESNLPIKVDILDWNAISVEFQEQIRQQHEVIQQAMPE